MALGEIGLAMMSIQWVWYPLVHLLNLENLRKVSQYRCMVNFRPDSKLPRGYGWIRFHYSFQVIILHRQFGSSARLILQ
uniref:Putative secreted protein n=1 Tax=Xenopsylla cheopis TaxID=163159 RepID=A0A6M2DWZ0_XENCH